ncbi:hypothetical protein QAD02_020461 [Eretmocerus hayati]|uniref:Uncharacterized protein n=1 Tax=Eretmocerus hayati TaxID=131215 RepID=A0ACC2PMJ7_9HYME|nr:hypothetical protein QAD02_020461 [Eretmocerus hayati]
MELSQCTPRVTSDRDIMDRHVLSSLAGDELEIVQKLCEITDSDSVFDSLNTEQNVTTSVPYMDDAVTTPSEFPNEFRSEHEYPDNTYGNTTAIVDSRSVITNMNNHDTSNEVLIEFTNATDLLSNNSVRTQVNNLRNTSKQRRIEEITADLMSYEQRNAQTLRSVPLQLDAVPDMKTFQVIYQSGLSTPYNEIDTYTPENAMSIANEVMRTGKCIIQYPIRNEKPPTDEFSMNTSERATNNTTEVMDYTSSVINFNENLLNPNSEKGATNTGGEITQYETVKNDNSYEIHSVEVRDELLPSYKTNDQHNMDEGPDEIMNSRTAQPNACNTMEITTHGDENVPGNHQEKPASDEEKSGTSTTATTNQVRDTPERHTRSFNKNQGVADTSNSRKRTLRTRYPDLNDLKKQAEDNCPDLDNPFWENIESFTCKRSVFYRKRSSVICHLSYFKEIHEPMGFKIDSKHVMIKSNKNPQMPICILCHNSHYEAKEAIKCEFCVKAYFELMYESEQGDCEDIIDK